MINDFIKSLPPLKSLGRLFHGRGYLSSPWKNLVIEYYPPYIRFVIYGELPVSLDLLCSSIVEHYQVDCEKIIVQDRRSVPWTVEVGLKDQEPFVVQEGSLSFWVNPFTPQNSGLFLDTKPLRTWLLKNSDNKKILNLFSYTCSLSVAAVAGGAVSVHNWDMKKSSLSKGRENHRLNGHDLSKVKYFGHDILKSFSKIGKNGPYDIVIMDPPPGQSFFSPQKDYPKLIRRSTDWVSEEGYLIAVLNSPDICFEEWRLTVENLGPYKLKEEMTSGDDFYEQDRNKGLKICVFQKFR
ncbi:class I SAM-dependent methyltransferase [Spirochaeta cellobiosiphila]|uniref:class I SAM-dependent methyltransferase n=1 Tax=Spirochaeta cellobiosiphila TaxID=504483 RepID=UPI00040A6901|nr:class I SAM-dependent methyltransferase [Spirochaeta cellobiosiphila]